MSNPFMQAAIEEARRGLAEGGIPIGSVIEYRGEMGVIPTKLEGVFFNEHLKQTAQVADKITVCRSMTHGEAAHERGTHNMFTGYRPSPALVYPSIGSVVSHEFGVRNNLPPYVCVPSMPTNFAGSGYLSSAFAPVPASRVLHSHW